MFSHSAQNNMEYCYFQHVFPEMMVKGNQNPSEDAKMRITSHVIFVLFVICYNSVVFFGRG